jgi:hypothetical protein
MSIFEKYAALYNERKFDADERAEIGKFVAGMMKCAQAGDKQGMTDLVNQHLAYASQELIEKIGRITTYIAFRGEERERAAVDRHITKEAFAFLEELSPHLEKDAGIGGKMLQALRTAGRGAKYAWRGKGGKLGPKGEVLKKPGGMMRAGEWWAKNYKPAIAAMAMAGVTAPVIAGGIRAMTQSGQLKNSLSRLLRQHPELRNDPNVAHYFQILTTFAPHVAQNPILAGNLLKRWHETGPDLITPNMIKELLDIENQSGNIERNTQNQVNAMSSIMMDVAKTDFGPKKGPTINVQAPTVLEMPGGGRGKKP